MRYLALATFLVLSIVWTALAGAHAFPEHSVPGAGAILDKAPATVTIYFDSELEPVFSTLIVKNEQGSQVSQGNGEVDHGNQAVLTTKLSTANKGAYHVYWSVIARDGHHTEGDYTFTVQ